MATSWIRTMREQWGWSTYELARRAGVSQPTVIHWERREASGTITLATLSRAAQALQCEVDYRLVRKSGAPPVLPADVGEPKTRKPMRRSEPVARPATPRSVDPNDIWQ